jgi:predicted nuclease with TOPRIM domain
MKFINLLLEGREEDFKTTYGKKFSPEKLDAIIKMVNEIPNGSKFLTFLGRVLPQTVPDGLLDEKVKDTLKKFVSIGSNLQIKDINQYKTFAELYSAIEEYETRIRRTVKSIEGADIVYENDQFTVVAPLTTAASCYYGAGTKWCTASSADNTHFNNYMKDGKLFYILDKTKPTSDRFYKVALLKKFEGDESYFDAPDDKFTSGWIMGTNKLARIKQYIDLYIREKYAKELEIWGDKEKAAIERKRLERVEQQRIENGLIESANQRREDDEWSLDNLSQGDMGSCAHALFDFLVSENTIEGKTPETKSEISRIENEIIRLQAEYDNDEELRGDLLDEISELEDELTELDAKMDVYDMLPTDDYILKGFTTTEFQGRWKVGDSDDTEREAVRYVKDMLDDVGYDGYNESFVMEHFDDDSFRVYLKDFFEEDVYNNPEVYLDDSDKELSRSQEARIVELKQMVLNLESERDSLDDEDEDYSDEYDRIGDEIDEANNEIEEIEDDPDGEYDSDKLDSIVADKISEHRYDAKEFYDNFLGGDDFSEWATSNGFIDEDEFAQAVVDTDGYGTVLNSYDGSEESVSFEGETYYIFYDGNFH